jgi:muramoyltetrapeptide carboxypeptidase
MYNNDLQPTIKPKALKKNDLIALVAPAGPISESKLAKAQENLLELGFRTSFTPRILNRKGYLAGNDLDRLDDLHQAFENPDVDVILCIRGGYGSARIIDQLDFQLIKRNPKIFIGYSDITALLNAIWQKTGLITFHGIVGTSAFTEYTRQQFLAVFSPQHSDNMIITSKEEPVEFLNSGKAKGRLVGGNLSIVNSLIGTGFGIDFTEKIVFLEDVGEAPYKIDRMLTQLLLSGKLDNAAGIVLGQFRGCDIDNKEITKENSLSLDEVFNDRLGHLKIPVIKDFSFGHISDQAIFPVGIEAEIDSSQNGIKLLESVFETV